ncbi:condensation domain-containing protein, partial [Streptomyces fungicidicus]
MIPLSFAQRRLWFLWKLEGAATTFNIPLTLRLSGPLDRPALDAALRDVIGRHEVLRTVLPAVDGEPYQRVLPLRETGFELGVVQVPPEEAEAAVRRASTYAFDLAEEIPVRADLFEVGPDEHVLALVVHHIAADGWSIGPLMRDLSTAYTARLAGRAPRWEPLPVQYADYALWQRELLGTGDDPESTLSEQVAYWRRTLAGAPEELELPTDRPRPAQTTPRGHTAELELPADTHRRLRELAGDHGASLLMVAQSALAVLLSRTGAGEDLPMGTLVAGRNDEGLNDLVGFFVNNLVIRADLSGDPTFTEVLERVREASLDAYEYQDVPFEKLVEELSPTRSLARHPLFQVMAAVETGDPMSTGPGGGPALELPGLHVEMLSDDQQARDLDLDLVLRETHDGDGRPAGLRGALIGAADLFDAGTVQRIADMLARVLEQVATTPTAHVRSLDVLDPEEHRRLLGVGSGAVVEVPGVSLPELFAARVGLSPDAVALAGAGVELSYGEVEARANRLARKLIGRGVGPESVVALVLERSPELVIAVLAVLKAGGAYVAVDPGQPADRIRFVVEDASPVLVIDDLDFLTETADYDAAPVSDADRLSPLLPSHPAYVIYTSGSTGRPKGVLISHAACVSYVA